MKWQSAFYKRVSFWCGIVLVLLDWYVARNIVDGSIFTSGFWTIPSNIEGVIFLVGGFILIFRGMFHSTENKHNDIHG